MAHPSRTPAIPPTVPPIIDGVSDLVGAEFDAKVLCGVEVTVTRDSGNDVELDFDPGTRVALEDPIVADEDIDDDAEREGSDPVSFPSLIQTPFPLLQQLLAFFECHSTSFHRYSVLLLRLCRIMLGPPVLRLLGRSVSVSLLSTFCPTTQHGEPYWCH